MRWSPAIPALAVMLALAGAQATEAPDSAVRFGLTGAVVRENLDLYDRLATYLGRKIGRPVRFEQRRTYREAMELLGAGEHDFSWICSLPYAKYRNSNLIGLMAVPVFAGEPLYHSYIIVNKGSSVRTIGDLEGRVFAYSDPDSNSGYLVPRRLLNDLGRNPDKFFRHTFFTYSHTETIEAVANRVADGAAVDSYIWEYLNQRQPHLTANTKVVQRSRAYGFPPLVYRIGVSADLRGRVTDALLNMDNEPEGRTLLHDLMLDRFIAGTSGLYDSVLADPEPR